MPQENYADLLENAAKRTTEEVKSMLAEYQTSTLEEKQALERKLDDLTAKIASLEEQRRVGLERNSMPGVEYDEKGTKPGRAFSIWRASQLAYGLKNPHGPCGYTLKDKRFGYEREVNAQAPEDAKAGTDAYNVERTYNVGTDSAGGVFVPQEVMADSIIPELDDTAVVRRAGATSIDSLSGDVTWPADEGGFAAYYPDTEGDESTTESVNSFGGRTARPHTMAALQRMSHKQMVQTNLEPFVRGVFLRKMALREDLSAVQGSGASGVPLGITNTTGVTNSTALDTIGAQGGVSAVNDFVYTIIENKAWDPNGSYAFIVSSDVAKEMQGAVDADGRPLFAPAGSAPTGILSNVAGFPLFISDQFTGASAGTRFALFGDFSKLLICTWNSLTIRATESGDDPEKLRMSIIGYQDHDFVLVHPEAFVWSDSVDTNWNG